MKNGSIKFQIVPNLNTSTDEAQGKDGNKIVQTSKPADENEIPETEQSDPKEKSSQALWLERHIFSVFSGALSIFLLAKYGYFYYCRRMSTKDN